MSKKICAICNRKVGMFDPKVMVSDGVVCYSCLQNGGVSQLSNSTAYDAQSIKELINSRKEIVKKFKMTKLIGRISLDDDNRLFEIGSDIFKYDNLLRYELLEDGHSVTKGGLGRAVTGGLLFGGVGAIVGGVTGKRKTSDVCNSMSLRVSLKNAHVDTIYIPFISVEIKKQSAIYRVAQAEAQQTITALDMIIDSCKSEPDHTYGKTFSAADEILKYKSLLEQGVITQQEFDAKKKELLGL